MPVVATDNVCLSYGRRRGVSNVSLAIEAGEIFGFLGPNGAGKSTTIRVLMGLLRASSGTASIFGRDCWQQGPIVRRDVGYVAGDVRLYPWLTIRRGLRMLSQVRERDVLTGGLKLAEQFRVEPDLLVRKMSRGNRQKVALVLAMAHDPQLLILDEPTSGLDPLMQDTLMHCLRERAAQGKTVMFSSHTLSEVESLCDRVAVIRAGSVVEDATLQSLKARAPREVSIRLSDGFASRAIKWPDDVSVLYQPGSPLSTSTALRIPANDLERCCLLELQGSSIGFMHWAVTQDFADVSISPPSLDALFRQYYESDELAA